MAQKNSTSAPDFAYPQKVKQTALRDLETALKSDNGSAVVNSLIRLGLAESAVSTDSLPLVLGRIAQVRGGEKNDVTSSMLCLLEAKIYCDIYKSDRWTIDQREVTAAAGIADDYRKWGRAQFVDKVNGLLDDALSHADALQAVSLDEYEGTITYDRIALTLYPTMLDFVAYRAIDIMDVLGTSSRTLSMALLDDPMDRSLYPTYSGSIERRVLDVYHMLMKGREESIPGIMARVNVMNYIAPRIFTFERPVFAFRTAVSGNSDVCQAFMNAYRRYSANPWSIEFILRMPYRDYVSVHGEVYDELVDFEKSNPDYANIDGVKQLISTLSGRNVTAVAPSQVAKGKPFTVEVSSNNVSEVTLSLYRVPEKDALSTASTYRGALGTPVQTVKVHVPGEVPFSGKMKATLTAPDYGKYVVAPTFEGMDKKTNGYEMIACSDLATGFVGERGGKSYAVVRNSVTGAPVEGVQLSVRPWDRRSASVQLPGLTDKDGFLLAKSISSGNMSAAKGKDRFSPGVSVYQYPEAGDSKTQLYGEFMTSLGLYRPGDRMEYAVVLYELGKSGRGLCTGRGVSVILRDANYQEVSRQSLTTDAWGRAQGAFDLPADGLTGSFSLGFAEDDVQGNGHFMVSDYKLPTFEVKVGPTQRPASLGEDAVISGDAVTYAGFPVEDGMVKMQLRVRTGAWWFAQTSAVFYEAEAQTDANGDFVITIPGGVIAASPCAQGYFMADIAVTSPDGETHSVSTGFNMGKPAFISVEMPAEYNAAKAPEVKAAVLDFDNKPVDATLRYKISLRTETDGNVEYTSVVKEGEMKPGNFGNVLASLPSGRYGVIFCTADDSVADPTSVADVTVWRPDDGTCVAGELLWLPEMSGIADATGKGCMTVGTSVPGRQMLMILTDGNGKIISSQWMELKGMQTVDLQLPAGVEKMMAFMSVVSDCTLASRQFTLSAASTRRKIEVRTTTFRDKVAPGDLETVTIKVTGVEGAEAQSALMLDMSNKAIDALCSNPFNFSVYSRHGYYPAVHYPDFGQEYMTVSAKIKQFTPLQIGAPEFEMYNRSFSGVLMRNLRVRGTMKMAKYDMTEEETADDMAVVTEHAEAVNMSLSAAPQAAAGAMMDGGVLEESGVEDAMAEDISYRPAELPLAFFHPMFTTDADGTMEMTYTVPDANTTWILRALAYNKELLISTDKVEIVASKPVMVSTNAPRFLRSGDHVRLLASVMNATDSAAVVRTVSELLSVSGDRVVAMSESVDTIGAMGRSVVGLDYEVPSDVQGLILRVKAVTGTFGDGEQVFIPVLPSEQNVVESTNFYIAPGENHFTMPLQAIGNGRAYLKYCGNPAWDVVSALPGLRQGDMTSSLSAAGQLYSAAVADGLMRSYPEIARTIRKWADNPTDSALTSMLEKNSQLKDMLLSSTPWVSDALSESERMQRLVLLLDGRNTSRAVNQAVAELRKTFVSGKGWAWTSQYPECSDWCTMQILDIFGGLNRLGWLPDNKALGTMIDEAVKYMDRTTAAEFARHPKADYTSYCYMRMKYPDIRQSTAAKGVVNAQVRDIVSGWKEHGVVSKAVDALILNGNGYAATARQILASLTEYATYTPEHGMWWAQLDNRYSMWSMDKVGLTAIILDAYATVSPSAKEVDRIRQWLVLNKADNSWGNAIITTQVVSSLLTSGSKWTVVPEGTAVRVNGTLLEPSAEYATGSFTEPVTDLLQRGGELVIDRQGNYPSYGGVLAMRTLPMDEIRAVGSDGLEIEKYISVFDGEKWVPSDVVSVGDRVKVTLALTVGKDMSYVVINDKRAAGLEPKEQLPAPVYSEGLCFYRENRDSQTNIFIDFLPKGTYMLGYELFATQGGRFASGVAQVQSQYNPLNTAHSAGAILKIR